MYAFLYADNKLQCHTRTTKFNKTSQNDQEYVYVYVAGSISLLHIAQVHA